jgi:hypothetical protein
MLCNTCKKSKICKEICRKLENYLERLNGKKGYTARHIRRREIPYSPQDFNEDTFIKRAVNKIRKRSTFLLYNHA